MKEYQNLKSLAKSRAVKFFTTLLIGALICVVLLEFYALLQANKTPALNSREYLTLGNIMIESVDNQERGIAGSKPFTRYEGSILGFDKDLDFSALDFIDPFVYTSAIASGDFNNDNWQDIILGNRNGILLYKNLGTGKFEFQEVAIPEINDLSVLVVAFVDIDNDGWQDIYLTSFGGKNYFLLNDKNGFQNPKVLDVPNKDSIATMAASFSDLDKDGDLDFVDGNWSYGAWNVPLSLSSVNKMITNVGLKFYEKNFEEIVGETLAILFADFTNDNYTDLIVANDYREPDIFYSGNVAGHLAKIKRIDNIIPFSAFNSMSIDVADFNNDLYMDIYIGGQDISTFAEPFILPADTYCRSGPEIRTRSYCRDIVNGEEKEKCEKHLNLSCNQILTFLSSEKSVERCDELGSRQERNDCIVMQMLYRALHALDANLCERIPTEYQVQKLRCRSFFMRYDILYGFTTPGIDRVLDPEISEPREGERILENSILFLRGAEEAIGQKAKNNVLLQGSKEGIFQDVSMKTNTALGGWTWNSKFADLDNDEWQDIYVVNGFHAVHVPSSNIFFHNKEGQFFETAQEKFNLVDFNMVVAYTYIDIDNDGDLDIISAGLNGPVKIYVNNETRNNSISFEFRDNKGNHFGIGNKIYIYYGENSERHQVREIKSGGGFLSFDPYIAHFGLGTHDTVHKVEIVWSTGEKTILDKEFLANKKYIVTRRR